MPLPAFREEIIMATSFSEYTNPYIDSLYEQKRKAAEDALTAAYQQNMANYDAQAQETSQNYANQRNQTQAMYERALRGYDEYAAAGGLNSGAKAQARLAYGAQNQSGLSNLSEGEAAALREIARNRTAAQNQYNADIAANQSSYDQDRYNALYQAWQDQVNQENADRSYYYNLAMNAIQTGSMPDANTLARAGIDSNLASTMAAYYRAGLSGGSSGGRSGSSSGSGGSVRPGKTLSGGLSGGVNPVISGAGTQNASKSASSAYASHIGLPSGTSAYSTISGYISSGKLNAANSALAMYANTLTKSQYNQLLSKINSASKKTTSSGGGGKMVAMTR